MQVVIWVSRLQFSKVPWAGTVAALAAPTPTTRQIADTRPASESPRSALLTVPGMQAPSVASAHLDTPRPDAGRMLQRPTWTDVGRVGAVSRARQASARAAHSPHRPTIAKCVNSGV